MMRSVGPGGRWNKVRPSGSFRYGVKDDTGGEEDKQSMVEEEER
jgi:hypothetical protein